MESQTVDYGKEREAPKVETRAAEPVRTPLGGEAGGRPGARDTL